MCKVALELFIVWMVFGLAALGARIAQFFVRALGTGRPFSDLGAVGFVLWFGFGRVLCVSLVVLGPVGLGWGLAWGLGWVGLVDFGLPTFFLGGGRQLDVGLYRFISGGGGLWTLIMCLFLLTITFACNFRVFVVLFW